MSQDPKKLPAWLSGKGKKKDEPPPPVEPPKQEAPPASDDGDLPPWLRTQQPPAPASGNTSQLRRLKPQQPEQEGGVPPWLAGLEEPKSVKIGGTELSEEYLKSADELPDSIDSELTYDSWMAQQIESKRVKDIEEEVPDDLISAIQTDEPVVQDDKKGTGQLPDWFLGLEELDTTEAPDWFNTDDSAPKAAPDQMPPWVSDMLKNEPAKEADPPVDDIGSFFNSIGSVVPDEAEEETPDLDWFSQPEEPEQRQKLPDTGYFRQLVGKRDPEPPAKVPPHRADTEISTNDTQPKPPQPPISTQSKQPPPAPARPQFELPDIDDFDDAPPVREAEPPVEIPQNELDAFFSNVASDRGTTPQSSFDDIEDPDMDWIVPAKPVAAAPESEPEAPGPSSEENTNWLNELQGIVSNATRPLTLPPEESIPPDIAKAWNAPPASAEKSEPEAFAWPETDFQDATPLEEAQQSEWLSGITPGDQVQEDQPDAEEAPPPPPPPPRTSMLASRLRQAQEQQPPPPPVQPDEESIIPEEELQTGWLTDDIFGDHQPAAQSDQQPSDQDFFSMLESNADANLLDEPDLSAFGSNDQQDDHQPATQASNDDDFYAALDFGDTQDDQPPATQASNDDDFYAALNFGDAQDDQAPVAETPSEPAQDDQFYSSLFDDQQDEQQPAALASNDDDFYAALNFGETQDDQQPVAETPSEESPQAEDDGFYNSLFGDQQDDQQPAAQASPTANDDDDFYAALNFGDAQDDQQPVAETPSEEAPQAEDDGFYSSLFDDQQNEQQPAALASNDDDFYAALNIGDAQDDQPPAALASNDDDFYAALNFGDAQDDQAPAAQTSDETETQDDTFYSSLFGDDEQDEQPAAQASNYDMPQTDDLFSSLNANDVSDLPPAASEEGLFEWDEQEHGEAEPAAQDDSFYNSLFGDEQDDQQPAAQASTDDMRQEDDFFSSLNVNDVHDLPPAASEEGLFGWDDQEQGEAEPVEQENDFLASLGMGDELEEEPPASETADDLPDDFFASLGMGDSADASDTRPVRDDAFVWNVPSEDEPQAESQAGAFQWETQKEMPPEDDFFAALGMIGDEQPANELPAQAEADEAPPEEDFFKSLGMIDEADAGSAMRGRGATTPAAFGDVDSYLASLNADQPELTPSTDDLFRRGGNVDIDALFSEPVLPEKTEKTQTDEMLPAVNEDWLAQLQASVGEVSASAIVRQKEDKPVAELSDRLKKLRARAEEIPDQTTTSGSDALDEVLPGVPTSLSAAPVTGTESVQSQSVVLTPEQQAKVDLLKTLIPLDERAGSNRMSAIEATYDSPFMPGLEDTPEAVLQPTKEEAAPKVKARPRRRRRIQLRPDRFLIAVVLALAVILPFLFTRFRIGSLPPATFAAGSTEQTAFNQLDSVPPGSLVLVGVEYGPTAAAELDPMTEAIVRHILLRASYPVLISSNAIGSLRISDLITPINADATFLHRIGLTHPLTANSDYYIIRYLPGSVIGLRAFSEDTADQLLSDIQGQATNLRVRSLGDFALIALVTDSAETVRNYAEQIDPLSDAPLISAVSYSAAPLAEPYVHTLSGGLLVGYQDAYTYNLMLGTANTLNMGQRIRIIPTDQPTIVPPSPSNGSSGAEGAGQATEESTTEAGAAATEQSQTLTATVVSKNSVNMRSGAGTTNPVVDVVPSGTQVTVLGYNADRSWVNVRLANGEEGWISAALLNTQAPKKAALLPRDVVYGKQRIDPGVPTKTPIKAPTKAPTEIPPTEIASATEVASPTEIASPTATPSEGAILPFAQATSEAQPQATTEAAPLAASATLIPTATATQTATVAQTEQATAFVVAPPNITFTLPPHSDGYQDERWYAMNLGIIASACIISFGAVFNVLRSLLRRGRSG